MAIGKAEERRCRRARSHRRVRKKVRGTAERPRLAVFRSLRHMEGQLVDDDRGMTLVGVSTRASDLPQVDREGRAVRVNASFAAGKLLAQRALEIGVKHVVFDRGGYLYHGRVQGFADGAREGGLQF